VPVHLSNDDTCDSTPSFGIDVGARRVHVVALDRFARVAGFEIVDVGALGAVAGSIVAAGAPTVAIDSPTAWSTAPHASETGLSPKFRSARCAEIALGRRHRLWVPWTTPVDPADAPAWMQVGVALAAALRSGGVETLEVYPYAAFRVLNGGGRLPPKHASAGRELRRALLRRAGVTGEERLPPSHDALDAAAAALVAMHRRLGVAHPATCGHDGSAIWLPAPAPPSAAGVAEASGPPL
jgi:predicted nuclease with RNAse H fold